MHGHHELGVALILPGLVTPSPLMLGHLAVELGQKGVTHRILVTQTRAIVSGWKNIAVGPLDEDAAWEVAKRHSQNCSRLVRMTSLAVPDLREGESLSNMFTDWAPIRGGSTGHLAWEGSLALKPWHYACEVAIPVIDSFDTLPIVIELLRAQSVRPFISITDTGSTPEQWEKLQKLRADDIEIHSLRFAGHKHSSDFVAVACDLAFSTCRTEKLVMIHSDTFLRQRTSLEQLIELCGNEVPVVGWQMTEREHPLWQKAVSHSLACFHMPTMDRIGATWSLRRGAALLNVEHGPNNAYGHALDTETALALVLAQNGIEPLLIGGETNFEPTVHPLARHVRTLAGSRLYSPAHRAKAEAWLAEAMQEAQDNLNKWKT